MFGFNWVGVSVGILGCEWVYLGCEWMMGGYIWAMCEIVCGCVLRECA